jgi:hypothetical protein
MKKLLNSLIICLCLYSFKVFSQGEIPVDMYTGQPSIEVPMITITSNDISVPVTLAYDINSASNKSPFGYGWNLSAGGSVSREVRSLPDDFGYGDIRKGWLYNNSSDVSVAADIGNFAPSADTLQTTASDETSDNQKLYSFGYNADTEPDIFNYSFGEVSGSFVFDNNLNIRTFPCRDIYIEPTYASGVDKKIISFKIRTNDGYVYTFSDVGPATRRTVKNQFLNNVYFLTTEFELYNYATHENFVTYNAEWNLSRIDSPNGSYVTFRYNPGSKSADREVNIGYYKELDPIEAGSTDLEVRNIYHVDQTLPCYYLAGITGSTGEKVDFGYDDNQLTRIRVSDTRKGSTSDAAFVKQFNLNYNKVDYLHNNYLVIYSRFFLSSITELSGCDRMPPMEFSYNGVDGSTLDALGRYDAWGYEAGYSNESHSMPKLYIYPAEPEKERYRLRPIPGYSGQEIVLNGVDRNASGMSVIGSLASITYPQGSITTFNFHPNQYLDTRTNANETAGGLRISQISYFDGYNSTPITKIFEYTDASGKSSGRLLRKPVLAMPAYKWKSPYNQNSSNPAHEKNYSQLSGDNIWKHLTMRTESDIAPSERTRGNIVGYTYVKVRRPGAGAATFEYHEPGTYGQNPDGAWEATINRFSRPNISPMPAMGIIPTGGAWRFPHAPNPSFDYERGLLWRKSEYNEAGRLIRKTETTYQNIFKSGSAPVKVWGLRYDKFPLCDDNNPSRRIYLYGKYFLLTDTEKVPWVETVTMYDASDPTGTKYTSESTEYIYGSANHKLLTQVKHTTGDGNIRSTILKYPKDYPVITGNAESAVLMLSYMRNNFMHGSPVETITTLKKGSDPERVTGASLIKFDLFGQTNPLPESIWTLSTQATIRMDSFKTSSVELQNGSYKLIIDPRYEKKTSLLGYTALGQMTSSKDMASRKFSGTFYGEATSLPVVQVNNATGSSVAFADFENTTGLEFSSGTPYYGTGRSGTNAFYPDVMLTKTITRAAVDNYVLSFWIRSNATVNFTINLKHTSGLPTYLSLLLSIAATGNAEFKYVQKIIPVGAVPAGNFVIELQAGSLAVPPTGGSSSGLLPVIDDVFFFPENASMTSFAYQIPYGVSTITSGTGESTHTVYDNLGREKYVMDRDRNIIKKNTYNLLTPNPLTADFSVPSSIIIDDSVTFQARVIPCLDNVTYSWNLGSGFVIGTPTLEHVFSQAGTATLTLKVSHPEHGEKTFTRTFLVQPIPLTISICAKGVMEYNSSTATIISSYTCPQISATPPNGTGVIFKVTSVTGCSGDCSYTWKMRVEGTSSWFTVASQSNQYTYPKVQPNTTTFYVMCEVRSESGGVAVSSPMSVVVTP